MLRKYGITLRALVEDDLEMVRGWRNDPLIKAQMNNKEYITQSAYKLWFDSLNNNKNIYFIIEIDYLAVGLVWANDISTHVQVGYYIYSDRYVNSLEGVKAIRFFHEYLFNKYGYQQIYSELAHTNKKAIALFKSFGYENIMHEGYSLTLVNFKKYLKQIDD